MPYPAKGVFEIGFVDGNEDEPFGLRCLIEAARDKSHRLQYSSEGYALYSCDDELRSPIGKWPDVQGGSIRGEVRCPDCGRTFEVYL